MTWPAALMIGAGSQFRSNSSTPKTVTMAVDVVVGEALAEDRVHRDQQQELEQRRQAARERVDAALAVELALRRAAASATSPLYRFWSSFSSGAEHLHPLRRDRLAPEERDQHEPDQTSVSSTIAIAMLPVSWSKKTRMMKKAWKIGVNSHATKPERVVGDRRRERDRGRRQRRRRRVGAGARAGRRARRREAGDATTSRTKIDEDGGPEPGSAAGRRADAIGLVKGPGRSRRDSPGGTARSASCPSSCP